MRRARVPLSPPPSLTVDKSNNAPLEELELPDGTTASLPTAKEGATVTFTLTYSVGTSQPSPTGSSPTSCPIGPDVRRRLRDQQRRVHLRAPYNSTTRTLTWTAANVTASGTVTYKAKVNKGAAALAQPLTNVATIDSAQTAPSSRHIRRLRPGLPLAETAPSRRLRRRTQPRRTSAVGLQPAAHPGDPRRADPRDRRLRHPGPGHRSPPEPPLGPSPSRSPDPSGVARPAGLLSLPRFMRRDPERRPTGALHLSRWGASVVFVRSSSRAPYRACRSAGDRRSRSRGRRARPAPSNRATHALDRGVAVVAHLEVGQQDAAGARRASRDPRPPGRRGAARPATTGPGPNETSHSSVSPGRTRTSRSSARPQSPE